MLLKDFFAILLKKWYILLSLVVLSSVLGFIITKTVIVKEYVSNSRAYVFVEKIDPSIQTSIIDAKIAAQTCVAHANSFGIYSKLAEVLNDKQIGDFSIEFLRNSIRAVQYSKELNIVDFTCSMSDPKLAQTVLMEFNILMTQSLKELPYYNQLFSMVVSDQPNLTIYPVSPNVMINLIISAIIGFILATLFVVGFEMLDKKFNKTSDATEKLHKIVLGEIITFSVKSEKFDTEKKGKSKFLNLFKKSKAEEDTSTTGAIVDKNATFAFKESYNLLAVNLNFCMDKSGGKVLCVTSANAKSGKSSVSLNISLSLAQMGARVLLVDCDLRKPSLFKYLKSIKGDELCNNIGLTDVVFNVKKFDDVIVKDLYLNLDILFSGTQTPAPQKVFFSENFKNIIKENSQNYDWIIIDTPPINIVADAVIINEVCDNSIFVIKRNHDELKDISAALEKLGTNCLGVTIVGSAKKSNNSKYEYVKYEEE